VAAALRAAVPEARIEMAARSPLAALAVGRGPINAAIDPEQIGLHHFYGHGSMPADVAERIHAYDLVINFLAGPRAHVSTRLRASAPGLVLSVDPGPEPGAAVRHIVEQWLATLGTAGLRLALRQERILELSEAERAATRGKLANLAGANGGRIVLCHPGAGGRAKCCPLEILETAIRRLRDRGDAAFWMIGPTEVDWHGQAYRDRLSRSAAVLYEESIPAAAALLGGADAFVGNDAGMTHIAAALGLETIALFGPTDPRVWRPLGPRVTALRFDATNESESLVETIVARVGQAG
jgi:ADP-heptose:LPS heptosyltransferase